MSDASRVFNQIIRVIDAPIATLLQGLWACSILYASGGGIWTISNVHRCNEDLVARGCLPQSIDGSRDDDLLFEVADSLKRGCIQPSTPLHHLEDSQIAIDGVANKKSFLPHRRAR